MSSLLGASSTVLLGEHSAPFWHTTPVTLAVTCLLPSEGEELFEEDPVCGMALLMFDQPNGRRHCQHCMRFLPETLEGSRDAVYSV